MPITLSDDARAEAMASIQRFFDAELDQDIGNLQSALVLDFVLAEIAPSAYNQGVRAAQTRLRDVVTDLDVSLAETEFAHTAALRTARNARR